MTKKNKPDSRGFVYSTDPGFNFQEEPDISETLPASQQNLRISLDNKRRAGKTVTLIDGFSGADKDLLELGKKIKTFCGSGGSARDGEIIVQGDQREKVLNWLTKNGYSKSRIIK
ncbi:MAG: translation initiation factor [Chitinophagaceae bacterium]